MVDRTPAALRGELPVQRSECSPLWSQEKQRNSLVSKGASFMTSVSVLSIFPLSPVSFVSVSLLFVLFLVLVVPTVPVMLVTVRVASIAPTISGR